MMYTAYVFAGKYTVVQCTVVCIILQSKNVSYYRSIEVLSLTSKTKLFNSSYCGLVQCKLFDDLPEVL